MAGKNCDLVTERKQFFPDPIYQQSDITAGQITSANAAGKKNVAADQQFILAQKETKAARAMAWNFQNLEVRAEKISADGLLNEKIRLYRFDFELETKAPKKFPVRDHWCRERMTTDLAAKLPLNHGNILNVIDVAVRQEQKFGMSVKRAQPFACTLRRVEQNRSISSLNQIAIRLENSAAKGFIIHGSFVATAKAGGFYEY